MVAKPWAGTEDSRTAALSAGNRTGPGENRGYDLAVREPPLGTIEPLPADIAVVPGTDVEALWEPFRFYEAGHHLMDIMNPLSSAGLDRLLAAIDRKPTERLLDIACGHGELLLRASAAVGSGVESAHSAGSGSGPGGPFTAESESADSATNPTAGEAGTMTGIDLSPWTLRRAHHRLTAAGADVGLVLGDGARYLEQNPGATWDVITLIGASWIWGGFEPSVKTLIPRLNPGGRLAVAEVIVTDPEARERLNAEYGTPLTGDELRAVLDDAGLEEATVITTTAQDWRDYDDRVIHGIRQWLKTFPDDTEFLQRQEDFEAVRADDADVTWEIWIGTAPRA